MRLNADENLMSSYTEMQPDRRVPIKAILLACSLLILGLAAIVSGLVITYTNITHKDHGVALFFIGGLMFLPGLYHTVVAYKAWKKHPGYSFSHLPEV